MPVGMVCESLKPPGSRRCQRRTQSGAKTWPLQHWLGLKHVLTPKTMETSEQLMIHVPFTWPQVTSTQDVARALARHMESLPVG